jgi:hypothetical protein
MEMFKVFILSDEFSATKIYNIGTDGFTRRKKITPEPMGLPVGRKSPQNRWVYPSEENHPRTDGFTRRKKMPAFPSNLSDLPVGAL